MGFFFASCLGLALAPTVDWEDLLDKEAFLFLPFPLLAGELVEFLLGLLQAAAACLGEPRLRQRPTVLGC